MIRGGIQQIARDLSHTYFEQKAVAIWPGIDLLGFIPQARVDLDHLARDGAVNIARGFDAFDHGGRIARIDGFADGGQLDEHHVAQLILGEIRDADCGDVALEPQPFV